MILKVRDDRPATNRFDAAGKRAEEQMAFYLARSFGPTVPDIFVLHDLRLPAQGVSGLEDDAAQIDHLIVHRHGLIIVESKSVTTAVTVNAHGEWARWWDGGWRGMQSPVHQARAQGEALRHLLQANREGLRDRKLLGLIQGGFRSCPIEVLVAFSDEAVVKADRGASRPPEVFKADAVAAQAAAIIERHRANASVVNRARGRVDKDAITYILTPAEMKRVCLFLMARHTPRAAPAATTPTPPASTAARASTVAAAPAAPPIPPAPTPAPPTTPAAADATGPTTATCRHCGSTAVRGGEARWGNRAYYTVCDRCGKGTDLDAKCRGCGVPARIRKDGPRYWRECTAPACGRRDLAFVSAAAAQHPAVSPPDRTTTAG